MNEQAVVRAALGTLTATLLILAAGYFALAGDRHFDPLPTVLLALLALVLQLTHLRAVRASVSLTSILLGAAIALSGPLGAAIVGLVSPWSNLRGRAILPTLFNSVMNGLMGLVGGFAFLGAGGIVGPAGTMSQLGLLRHELLPLGVATVVMLACNMLCVGWMISVTGGPPTLLTARRLVQRVGRVYVGYAVVAFLAVVLWDAADLGPASMLVVLAPLVLARWSYSEQIAETVAHERTVSSLVAAVDARDPVRRGRNQQVAVVAELVGNQLRLTLKQSEALHFAALLHDIGMITPATSRDRDHSQLQDDDLERIRRHPELGVEMLRSIVFLGDAITAIRAHHERWDGRGYPQGLSGPAIPLLARILAVADAVCALVAEDPEGGVDRAVGELRARSGSQFDPACVAALELVRDGVRDALPAAGADPFGAPSATGGWDHDLPRVSDLLAERTGTCQ